MIHGNTKPQKNKVTVGDMPHLAPNDSIEINDMPEIKSLPTALRKPNSYSTKTKRVCCWKVQDYGKKFNHMSKEEKKERINYLWGRLRAASKIRGGLNYAVNRDNEKDRENFGLDSDVEFELSESQELEEQLSYENEDEFNDLAWYLINP